MSIQGLSNFIVSKYILVIRDQRIAFPCLIDLAPLVQFGADFIDSVDIIENLDTINPKM